MKTFSLLPFHYYLIKWGCSSAGRAPALQAGGQGFDSLHLHQSTMSTAKLTTYVVWEANEKVRVDEIHRELHGLIAQVVRARA